MIPVGYVLLPRDFQNCSGRVVHLREIDTSPEDDYFEEYSIEVFKWDRMVV